jgi:hypothetical protein
VRRAEAQERERNRPAAGRAVKSPPTATPPGPPVAHVDNNTGLACPCTPSPESCDTSFLALRGSRRAVWSAIYLDTARASGFAFGSSHAGGAEGVCTTAVLLQQRNAALSAAEEGHRIKGAPGDGCASPPRHPANLATEALNIERRRAPWRGTRRSCSVMHVMTCHADCARYERWEESKR